MSEKRFFVEEIDTNQYGVYDRLKIGYIKPLVYTDWTVGLDYTQSVCDLLNDCDEKMNEVYEKLIIGKGSSEVIDMIKFGDNLCGVAIKELFDRNKKLQEENKQLKSELNDLKDMEKSIKSERFYIHCGDDINKQLFDTESDFNIHIEEICSDEELIRLCNLLNEQQSTIQSLKEENDNCRNDYRGLFSNYIALEEENNELKKTVGGL